MPGLVRLTPILLVLGVALAAPVGRAQDFFIPGQPGGAAPASGPRKPQPQKPRPASQPQPQTGPGFVAGGPEVEQPLPQIPLPPVPNLPPLPKGATPPAAVIGVISVPDIMRASVAAQAVEKTINERRDRLGDDAQKEQGVWRDMQQSLANERAKLTPDQGRQREKDLQERITNAQKQFRDRNRVLQEQAQYAIGQIEQTLVGVIKQVAESRGMNLVLHRQQVALNVNEFDITEAVTGQLNTTLGAVQIPAEGVSPVAAASGSGGGAPTPTPAKAPAAPAP